MTQAELTPGERACIVVFDLLDLADRRRAENLAAEKDGERKAAQEEREQRLQEKEGNHDPGGA